MEKHLHLESKLHALVNCAHVDPDHPVNESFFIYVFIVAFSKQAEKSIVDVARQICILEECDLVNELKFVISLFRAMPSHCDVLEDRLKVGSDFLLKKFAVLFIKLFNHEDFRVWRMTHCFLG